MCAKKLKYAAGDDFVRYATPKEAMEETRREFDKERQRQQQMKTAQPQLPILESIRPQFLSKSVR